MSFPGTFLLIFLPYLLNVKSLYYLVNPEPDVFSKNFLIDLLSVSSRHCSGAGQEEPGHDHERAVPLDDRTRLGIDSRKTEKKLFLLIDD
jgi:hypothetical protein